MRSARWIGKWWLLAMTGAYVTSGCHSKTPSQVPSPAHANHAQYAEDEERRTLQRLRQQSKQQNTSLETLEQLATYEALGSGGSLQRASATLATALEQQKGRYLLWFLKGITDRMRGDLSQAYESFYQALVLASQSSDSDHHAPHVQEASIAEMRELRPLMSPIAAGNPSRVMPVDNLATRTTGSFAARQRMGEWRVDDALRQGLREQAQRAAKAVGCITQWEVTGPHGPWELLGFDDPIERYTQLASQPTRTRPQTTVGCTLHLARDATPQTSLDRASHAGGTSFATSTVHAPKAGSYAFRVETQSAVELWVDGARVLRSDRRTHIGARTLLGAVTLSQGEHSVWVRVTNRHPRPQVIVAFSTEPVAKPAELPAQDDLLGRYLRAYLLAARGDVIGAKSSLTRSSQHRTAVATALLQLQGDMALVDPFFDPGMRRNRARAIFERAARQEPWAWYPRYQLARLNLLEEKYDEGIDQLVATINQWPSVSTLGRQLASAYASKGWDEKAQPVLERAHGIAPSDCDILQQLVSIATQNHRMKERLVWTDRLMQCDARWTARLQLAYHTHNWKLGFAETQRLYELGVLSGKERAAYNLQFARGDSDPIATSAALEQLDQYDPTDAAVQLSRTDEQLASGHINEAAAILGKATAQYPDEMLDLHRTSMALRQIESAGRATADPSHAPQPTTARVSAFVDELSRFRKSGLDAIREFEAQKSNYSSAYVMVLDYAVQRYFEDGSLLQLIHNVFRVQSQEGISALGEFQPPADGWVLQLRTIKENGQIVEPDVIRGKSSLSLPKVQLGDYIEYEYVVKTHAPSALPQGVMGDRFVFQSLDVPYNHSELVVVAPKAMELVIDPRGAVPPKTEEVQDTLRVWRWAMRRSMPRVPEPMSVAPQEFLPSIAVSRNATWPRVVTALQDLLADRSPHDEDARRLVEQITRGVTSAQQRAARVYEWVVRNITETQDYTFHAPTMVHQRAGSRARVLHYLLHYAQVPSTFALAASSSSDATPTPVADIHSFRHPLVLLTHERPALWLDPVARNAPFGFVTPQLRGQPAVLLQTGGLVVRVQANTGATGTAAATGLASVNRDHRAVDARGVLRPDGGAQWEVRESFTGYPAVSWREQLDQLPQAEIEPRFAEHYVSRVLPSAEMKSLVIHNPSPRAPLRFQYTAAHRFTAQRTDRGLRIHTLFPSSLASTYAQLPTRRTTQLVEVPLSTTTEVHLQLPKGWRLVSTPKPQQLTGPLGARFSRSVTQRGDVLVVHRSIFVPAMRIAPQDYSKFAQFCRRVDELEAEQLQLQPSR